MLIIYVALVLGSNDRLSLSVPSSSDQEHALPRLVFYGLCHWDWPHTLCIAEGDLQFLFPRLKERGFQVGAPVPSLFGAGAKVQGLCIPVEDSTSQATPSSLFVP